MNSTLLEIAFGICIGDGNELEQMNQQNPEFADKYKFWASKCNNSSGIEMRKIHTGLPALIVRTISKNSN